MQRGDLAKIVISTFLLLFLVFVGVQIYTYRAKSAAAETAYDAAKARMEAAESDKQKLSSELDYYENPENREKELKGRFNYRTPDEKTLILVPKEGTN